MTDTLAESADFDGVEVSDSPLGRLALYWAVYLYDEEFNAEEDDK